MRVEMRTFLEVVTPYVVLACSFAMIVWAMAVGGGM